MKELKDLADKEKSEMLDEDFLETTLYPIVDANKAKRKANRKRKAVSIIAGVSVGIVAVFGVGLGIIVHQRYAETYATKKSDISYLNSTLVSTQLIGDFNTITLTYETRRNTPVYFSVYRVEEGEGWMQSLSLKVIVKQDYKIDEIAYLDQFEFLGYTVHYSAMKKTDASTEPMLYGYKADAFIDTGTERYVMEYVEFRTEDNYHFVEYLQKTIKQK